MFVSFAADARDRSARRPVASIAGHPSLLPCKPPRFQEAWGPPQIRDLHDVGLAFLAEPVRDIKPARLARVGSLHAPRAPRAPMRIVGYGLLTSIPVEQRWAAWDGVRHVRTKSLVQVVDDAWATWALPGEVCNGDSGGPIFVGSGADAAIVATVSYTGGCRSASLHARVDVAVVQSWIAEAINANLRNQVAAK
jgi:trypsin